MYAKKVAIPNASGLHARPASMFVAEASKFKSEITLKKLDANGVEEKSCPAKSIVFVLTMGLAQGTVIEIVAEGEDEQAAVDTLAKLVEDGFGEL